MLSKLANIFISSSDTLGPTNFTLVGTYLMGLSKDDRSMCDLYV